MPNKREVVVRPVHRDEPDLHKLAEAMIRLVLEESDARAPSGALHSRRPRFGFHSLAREARTLPASRVGFGSIGPRGVSMYKNHDNAPSGSPSPEGAALAVSYLRVSTKGRRRRAAW